MAVSFGFVFSPSAPVIVAPARAALNGGAGFKNYYNSQEKVISGFRESRGRHGAAIHCAEMPGEAEIESDKPLIYIADNCRPRHRASAMGGRVGGDRRTTLQQSKVKSRKAQIQTRRLKIILATYEKIDEEFSKYIMDRKYSILIFLCDMHAVLNQQCCQFHFLGLPGDTMDLFRRTIGIISLAIATGVRILAFEGGFGRNGRRRHGWRWTGGAVRAAGLLRGTLGAGFRRPRGLPK